MIEDPKPLLCQCWIFDAFSQHIATVQRNFLVIVAVVTQCSLNQVSNRSAHDHILKYLPPRKQNIHKLDKGKWCIK